ncbi:thiamine-phosphate synthase [Thraustotheca clavata]|uniref:thiamine phosphate synthase n=1 Tax=Thraustotheca clavata TaxID=74557 RepID=A0A1W0A9C8_9STRA|nr:thiamine-phosphate synthase [Thraustotheca clavata]
MLASTRTLAARPWLYLVTPSIASTKEVVRIVDEAIQGGVNVVQLRNKLYAPDSNELREMAQAVREITQAHQVPFLVNDYVQLALSVGADGAHIGQEDATIDQAKALIQSANVNNFILGVTVRDAIQATAACKAGASYLGVGPVYMSSTKKQANDGKTINLDGLESVATTAASFHVPIVAIGGINASRVESCMNSKASGVAVVAAISEAQDIRAASAALWQQVSKYHAVV